MAELKYAAPTNVAGVSSQTINSGAGATATEFDNETNLHRRAFVSVKAAFTVAPTGAFEVYFLRKLDGTNIEDGGASTQPGRQPDAVVPMRNATGTQKVSVAVPGELGPFKFTPLLWNATDQNSDASSCDLDIEVFGENV
jgi:hypothetical protein